MSHSPEVVAQSFIKQYYELLSKSPQELYRFYKDSSSFTHAEGQQISHSIEGAELIREKVLELNLAGARFDLSDGSVDAHVSEGDGVIVLVTGRCTIPGERIRHFSQLFFLARQATAASFYVRNSILRLLEPVTAPALVNTGVSAAAPAAAPAAVEREVQPKPAPVAANDQPAPVQEKPVTGRGKHRQAAPAPADVVIEEVIEVLVPEEEESVVVIIEDSAGVEQAMIISEDTATALEDLVEEVEAALAISEAVEALSAVSSGPKSFADLFKPWASVAAKSEAIHAAPTTVTAPAPKKTQAKSKTETPKARETGDKTQKDKDDKKPNSANSTSQNSVFVRQLPEGISSTDISKLFTPFGTIVKIDYHPGRNFAFVELQDAAGVAAVAAKIQQDPAYFTIQGKQCRVEERSTNPRPQYNRPSGNKGHGVGKNPKHSNAAAAGVTEEGAATPSEAKSGPANKDKLPKKKPWGTERSSAEAQNNAANKTVG